MLSSVNDDEILVHSSFVDPEWDRFVRLQPDGRPTQCSAWTLLKQQSGWGVRRVVVTRSGEILGGAQVFLKAISRVGHVAYLQQGPIFSVDDPSVMRRFFLSLTQLLSDLRVRYCALQPTTDGQIMREVLDQFGFTKSPSDISPQATTFVRVDRDDDNLLASMKPKMRYNVRLGCKSELDFREVSYEHANEVHGVLCSTAKRQRFSAVSADYIRCFIRDFGSRECGRMFAVYNNDKPVSALLAAGFGESLIYKRGGWTGEFGALKPNEYLHWSAMRWARENGYRYYDFDGIDTKVGLAILRGEDGPQPSGVTRFKLGFGGEVRYFAPTFEIIRPRVVFSAYKMLLPIAQQLGVRERLVRLTRRS